MKHGKALTFAALVFGCAEMALTQINCPTNATSLPLVCEVPIAAAQVPSGQTAAVSSAQANTVAINASIAAQLTQLPVPSGTVGTVLLKGGEAGIVYSNLGPILSDRPDTVGRHRLYAGFSYQHFNFNAIDGIGLNTFPFAYQFTPPNTTNAVSFGTQTSSIGFSLDQYVAQVTFGASPTTDVSAIVPINSVHLSSTTTALTYTCNPIVSPTASCAYGATTPLTTAISGSASGVGDLQLTVKQLIHGEERSRSAIAVGGTLRLPTGDQNNYLGSGAYGFSGFALFSYRARFSPHLKIGNQWNGPSPLVNSAATNGEKNLPGGVQYDAGLDASINRHLTGAVDILGNQFTNTTSLQLGTLALSPGPSTTSIPSSLVNTNAVNNTYTTVNVSAGFKYKPNRDLPLLFYGNVLIQLNNVGLRSDPVPLAGISYNFKLRQ